MQYSHRYGQHFISMNPLNKDQICGLFSLGTRSSPRGMRRWPEASLHVHPVFLESVRIEGTARSGKQGSVLLSFLSEHPNNRYSNFDTRYQRWHLHSLSRLKNNYLISLMFIVILFSAPRKMPTDCHDHFENLYSFFKLSYP
jgi:hypothetical protein